MHREPGRETEWRRVIEICCHLDKRKFFFLYIYISNCKVVISNLTRSDVSSGCISIRTNTMDNRINSGVSLDWLQKIDLMVWNSRVVGKMWFYVFCWLSRCQLQIFLQLSCESVLIEADEDGLIQLCLSIIEVR